MMYCLRNKISQEELADLAHISRVHISYLERGERFPSLDSFINIANALNVSADELLADNLLVTGNNMNSEELDPPELRISINDYDAITAYR